MIVRINSVAGCKEDQFRQTVKEGRSGTQAHEKLHVGMSVADRLISAFENVKSPNNGGQSQKHLKKAVINEVFRMREEIPFDQEENDGAGCGEKEKHVLYE